MRTKPSAAVIAGVVVGLIMYGLAGYFLLISPQKGKAADLKRQTEATQQQIDQYRTLAAQARATPPIRVAELFRLTKAMPDTVDMAGVILELSAVARESGIEFDSITPQGATPVSGYSLVPLSVEFDGNFYELSDFLFRLRNLVRVHAGQLDAQGRLFVVDSVSFGESTHSFPMIKASLTVHAFVYGDVSMAARPAAETAPTTTNTTSTSTTTEPTTTAASTDTPPAGASAAPGTP
ncbi:MAG TPA: type 4a pilus biogenesis protein PilO [Gaiellaceae bacterium]|nr:type 4a pilus biogenesis protein PilO [Gaiellaceae bacterium]